MIRVNLLPQTTDAKGKAKAAGAAGGGAGTSPAVVNLLIVMILAGSFGGAGYWWWNTQNIIKSKEEQQANLKDEVKDLEEVERIKGQDFRKLKELEEAALAKGQVLLTLDPPDRIIWAEKLNMLSELRPEGISLTELKLEEDVKLINSPQYKDALKEWERAKAEAAKSKKKRGGPKVPPKPKPIKIPVITQTLELTGIAYKLTLQERLEDINGLRDSLNSYYVTLPDKTIRRFMDGLDSEIRRGDIQEIENYQNSGRLVTQFSFTIKTPPMGNTDPEILIKRLTKDLERRRRVEAAREQSAN
jgi:hypothetical protein